MVPDGPVPADLMQRYDPELIFCIINWFVMETRKIDHPTLHLYTLRLQITELN